MTHPVPTSTRCWAPPPVVDGFRLVRELRRCEGLVHYLAFEEELAREVAVTFTLGPVRGRARERARADSARVARVSHPNVVALHHLAFLDDRLMLVTGLVAGGTLEEVTRPPVPWQRGLWLAEQLASGLAALHAAGVVHRNVNLPSIRVGADGHPVLMDIASPGGWKDVAGGRGAGAVRGHDVDLSATVAPELRGSDREPDARADVFALGVVLHQLWTGQLPNGSDALRRHVPPVLAAVVEEALTPDPSARPANGSELSARLGRARLELAGRRRAGLPTDPEVLDLHCSLERAVVRADVLAEALSEAAPALMAAMRRERSAELAAASLLRLAIAELEHPDLLEGARPGRARAFAAAGVGSFEWARGTAALSEALARVDPEADRATWEEALAALRASMAMAERGGGRGAVTAPTATSARDGAPGAGGAR